MSSSDQLSDPWAPDAGTAPPVRTWPRLLGATALGALGPVGRLIDDSGAGSRWTDGLVLVAVALVAAMLTRSIAPAPARPARRWVTAVSALAFSLALALALAVGQGSGAAFAVLCAVVTARLLESAGPAHAPAPVLPLPLVAAAGWLWMHHAAVGISIGVALGALGFGELLARSSGLRRVDDLVRRGVDLIATTIIPTVATLAVAIPLLYVPMFVTRMFDWIVHGSGREEPPAWAPVLVAGDELRRDAPYPFATTPKAVRRRRLAVSLTIAFAGTALLAAGWWSPAR